MCVLRACPENEPSDKGLSIVLKGRNHSRNDDDVIVPYHCYQECNDDTDQTIPKYRPILLRNSNEDTKCSFCFIIHPFST